MSSNPCNYMDYRGRETADQGGAWLVGHRSVGGRKLRLRAIGSTPAVCDMNSAAAAVVCGLWRYTSVICLCLDSGLLSHAH